MQVPGSEKARATLEAGTRRYVYYLTHTAFQRCPDLFVRVRAHVRERRCGYAQIALVCVCVCLVLDLAQLGDGSGR